MTLEEEHSIFIKYTNAKAEVFLVKEVREAAQTAGENTPCHSWFLGVQKYPIRSECTGQSGTE